LLGCYLIASGAGRFLVEFLGRNPVLAFRLTEAQLVSAAMMAGGVLILGYIHLSTRAGTAIECSTAAYLETTNIS
jgi:prolipoprotein diacylglyceryltransferase